MARLNEPPMSLDNIETLRRKFLRQNREIARANSVQSQRIRSLESECGRLLSENLSLSGRILELEKELEQSRSAQRIADHALEIREKMEAQLVEWGAMILGLGVEPAAKRHASTSPNGTRIARPRRNSERSPAAKRRPRDSRTAEEIASLEEGRLPPIFENPTYPRRTMSHAEVLSLCNEAEENDSPDLGPPPTSRFVEEDPIKIDSPSKSTGALEASPKIRSETLAPPEALQQPKLDPKKKPVLATDVPSATSLEPTKSADAPVRPPLVKAGSKRKFGEETCDAQPAKAVVDNAKASSRLTTNSLPASEDTTDPIKPPNKQSEKSSRSVGAKAARPRKPLADKTVNSDLMSPKRIAKSASTDDLKKATIAPERTVAPLKKKRLVPIKLAMPQQPAPSAIEPREPTTPSAEPEMILPDTPENKSAEVKAHDTPPPADISSRGETSRPSRRARASISYAEPNLRDKMRRPTKELFDAVTGEGKYVRHSAAHLLAALNASSSCPSSSASKPKSEDNHSAKGSANLAQDAETAMASEAAHRPLLDSPLLEKETSKEQIQTDFPESMVTERRRKPSARHSQLLVEQILEDEEVEEQLRQESKKGKAVDPYEFNSTSPPTLAKLPELAATTTRGRITKGMRRSLAASFDEVMAGEEGGGSSSGSSSRPARKRVSLAAVSKKSLMLDAPFDDESSSEYGGDPVKGGGGPGSLTGKERVSRRRSMML